MKYSAEGRQSQDKVKVPLPLAVQRKWGWTRPGSLPPAGRWPLIPSPASSGNTAFSPLHFSLFLCHVRTANSCNLKVQSPHSAVRIASQTRIGVQLRGRDVVQHSWGPGLNPQHHHQQQKVSKLHIARHRKRVQGSLQARKHGFPLYSLVWPPLCPRSMDPSLPTSPGGCQDETLGVRGL